MFCDRKPTNGSPSDPRNEHVGIAENLVEAHDGLGPMVVHFDGLLAPRDLDHLLPLRPERGVELDEDLSRPAEPDPLDRLDLGRGQGRVKQ